MRPVFVPGSRSYRVRDRNREKGKRKQPLRPSGSYFDMRSCFSRVRITWMPMQAKPPYMNLCAHRSRYSGITSCSEAPIVRIRMMPFTPLLLGKIWPKV